MSNKIRFENIPKELKKLNQWVLWKYVQKENKKPDKPPYDAKSGKLASTDKPATWCDFVTAVKVFNNGNGTYDGIGFVFTESDPYVGIDIDNILSPTQEESHDLEEVIHIVESYTEYSPSGTGFHIIAKGKIPRGGQSTKDEIGAHIEMYKDGRYFTFTGLTFNYTTIEDRSEELLDVFTTYIDSSPAEPIEHSQVDFFEWDKDIMSLPVSDNIKELIVTGVPYPERSEPMMSVLNALAAGEISDEDIINIFKTNPDGIGEKFVRDRRGSVKWLKPQIDKARTYVAPETPTATVTIGKGKKMKIQAPKKAVFPYWIMDGASGAFADVYSSYLEAPKEFFFMAFLTVLGAYRSTNLTIKSEVNPQPRMFTILLGESADDRKSTAISKTIDFFRDSMDDNELRISLGVGSAEGLQQHFEECNKLLLCYDEFKQFTNKCQIQGQVLLPCVNTLFESNRYGSRTKKTKINLHNAHLSLLAASTLATYQNTWTHAFTDIGFNNRLFLVVGRGERRFSIPQKIPEIEMAGLKEHFYKIINFTGKKEDKLELDLTKGARDLFHDWYINLERSIHNKRLDTYALRLMCLLAVNELKSEIDVDVVNKVVALCDWQLQIRKLNDPIDADTKHAKLEQNILRQLESRGQLKDRELKQFTNARRYGLSIYNECIRNLINSGEIGIEHNSKEYYLIL